MERKQTEGIVLRVVPFGDRDQIVTLFSEDQGVIKFFYKGARRRKGSAISPLLCIELIYSKRNSELLCCHEVNILNQHLQLRKNLDWLEGACGLLKALLVSQLPNKPAPVLYQLLMEYLKKIPLFLSTDILISSFLLKVLRHEGVFGFTHQCSVCQQALDVHHICLGEDFCQDHVSESHLILSQKEAELMVFLAFCRSFSRLAERTLPALFLSKVERLFEVCIVSHFR